MGDIKKFTTEEVAKHNVLEGPNKSTWVIYEGGVYDITKFVSEHPGGTEVLSDTAGTDITRSFTEIGHSDHARGLMKPMKLGEIEGYVPAAKTGRRAANVSSKEAAGPHANQSSGLSPLLIALIVVILAVIAYGIVSST